MLALPVLPALTPLFAPLHSGEHDSAGDLTLGDYAALLAIVVALGAVGYALYLMVQRRRGGGPGQP